MASDHQKAHPVILAGGFGTRLRHVLGDVPKPMAPVLGRPFVEWVIRRLRRGGLDAATIATGFQGEVIERHFASQPVLGIAVSCVRETTPLGTGGAFVHAARRSGRSPEAWLVLNGDSLIGIDLADAWHRFQDTDADAALVARRVESPGRYGILEVGPDGRLWSFSEKPAAEPSLALINAGIYLIQHRLFERLPDSVPLSFELDVFPDWLRSGVSIAVLDAEAPFLDIGTEESLALADDFIDHHRDWFA